MTISATLLSAVSTSMRVVDSRLHRLELRNQKLKLRPSEERTRSLDFISRIFDCDAGAFLRELENSTFRVTFRRQLTRLHTDVSRYRSESSSEFDCETLYVTVRAAKPNVVVETGVLYGAFSAHILEALSKNGQGELVSFDLPERRGRNELKDYLVPTGLRSGRRLVLGNTRDTLVPELVKLGTIDLFNHDSWHAFAHMMWEFLVADRQLRPGGVMCSHDVLGTTGRPNAFPVFAEARGYTHELFRNFGIARKALDARP